MKKLLSLCLVFLFANNLFAFEEPGLIEFDLLKKDKYLSVGLNISGIISTQKVDLLKDGVEYVLDLKLHLYTPKRLWGNRTVVEKNFFFNIGYRIITEDFYFVIPQLDNKNNKKTFKTLRRLHQYLSDSLVLDIKLIDSLSPNDSYVLGIELDCISMTSLNLSPADSSKVSESPVKYLFKEFLTFTGYGREKYRETSRSFFINELNGH